MRSVAAGQELRRAEPKRQPPKKTRRVFSRGFKVAYFTVMSVLIAATGVGLALFWSYLAGYEKTLPENLARGIYNERFETLDLNWLYSYARQELSEFESETAYKQYVSERANSGKLSLRTIPAGTGAGKIFAVFSGETRLAELTLTQSAETELWALSNVRSVFGRVEDFDVIVLAGSAVYLNGVEISSDLKADTVTIPGTLDPACKYDKYAVSGLSFVPHVEIAYRDGVTRTLSFDGNSYSDITTVTAKILEGGVLYINGIAVGDSFLAERDIKTAESERLGLSYRRYKVNVSAGVIDVGVANKSGKPGVMLQDGDTSYSQEIVYVSDSSPALEEFAKNATMTYARYGSNHATTADLAKYFDTQSATYKALAVTETIWFASTYPYSFKNAAVSEIYEQDSNVLSCRVTLDHYITVSPTDIRLLPLDITLFIKNTGGKYLIINLVTNA